MRHATIAALAATVAGGPAFAQDEGCRLVYATLQDMANGVQTCAVKEEWKPSDHDRPGDRVVVARPATPELAPAAPSKVDAD